MYLSSPYTTHSRAVRRACLHFFVPPPPTQCLRWWFTRGLTSWFCSLTELSGTFCQLNMVFQDTDATPVWSGSLILCFTGHRLLTVANCFINTWSWRETFERTVPSWQAHFLTGKWYGSCLTNWLTAGLPGERRRILSLCCSPEALLKWFTLCDSLKKPYILRVWGHQTE